MEHRYRWTFNRVVVLGLVGTFAVLVIDLLYDHNHVIRKHPLAWTPILFSAAMIVLGAGGLVNWDRGGRQALTWLFAASCIVGVVGFWLHNSGHLVHAVGVLASVWRGQHPDPVKNPPVLSPLAFTGLGALGMLACNTRCEPPAS